MPSDMPGAFAMGLRRPVGVVAAISPWNAALILSARSIAAPLVFGNTVVLKPSEESPYVGGLSGARSSPRPGCPTACSTSSPTTARGRADIGSELVENPRVRRINFTGSTATGRKLAEAAGRHLKRVVLELGGQNPLIVLADADLRYAVDAAAFGAYLHQGQICMSARRIIVEQPIAEAFIAGLAEKVAGSASAIHASTRPSSARSSTPPLSRPSAGGSTRPSRAGAKVLAGGSAEGACYRATLLTDVPRDSEFAQLETFGPVASIEVVADADEAVAAANATSYGLSSGVITTDPDKGLAIASRLEAGIVHVNDQPVHDEPQMPFGGVKDSGWGRFGGTFAMDEFTELQWVTVQSGTRPFPF